MAYNYNYYPSANQLIWVQGEEAAKAYNVAPNSAVALWDSDEQIIYLKQSDNMGRPSMKILDYTIREVPKPEDKLATLESEIASLKEQLESMKKGKKKNEPVVSVDESE